VLHRGEERADAKSQGGERTSRSPSAVRTASHGRLVPANALVTLEGESCATKRSSEAGNPVLAGDGGVRSREVSSREREDSGGDRGDSRRDMMLARGLALQERKRHVSSV
jgi:hypothetical protein